MSIGLDIGKNIVYLCEFIDRFSALANEPPIDMLNLLIYKLGSPWYFKRSHEAEYVRAKILAQSGSGVEKL